MKDKKMSKGTSSLIKDSSLLQKYNQNKQSSYKSNYYSNSNSTSNSFRQTKFKTAKASPEKNHCATIIQKEEEIITEGKEMEDFIRKKFLKKKHPSPNQSNFLNFTNPIYKANKIVINKKDLKNSTVNQTNNQYVSNADSVNTSMTKGNYSSNPQQIEKEKEKEIQLDEKAITIDVTTVSPRCEVIKKKKSSDISLSNSVNKSNNNIGEIAIKVESQEKNVSVNKSNNFIYSKISVLKGKTIESVDLTNVNSNNNNKIPNTIAKGYSLMHPNPNIKRSAYTAKNSRKNSAEKKVTKLVSNVSNKRFTDFSCVSKEKKKPLKSGNINAISSTNFVNNSKKLIKTFKDFNVKHHVGHSSISMPVSVSHSKSNSKARICVEVVKAKIRAQEKKLSTGAIVSGIKNYTSNNSPSHKVLNVNSDKQSKPNKGIIVKTATSIDKTKNTNSNSPKTNPAPTPTPTPKESRPLSKKPSNNNSNKSTNTNTYINAHTGKGNQINNMNNINKLLMNIKQDSLLLKDKKEIKDIKDITIITEITIENHNNIPVESNDKHKRNTVSVHPNNYFNQVTHSSLMSTMRDSKYYLHESEKLKSYVKTYYLKNKEYPPSNFDFYKIGRIIGRGAFGKVNLGLNILTGRIVAIKSFNKASLTNEVAKQKIIYETNIMRSLRHPSITKILETFETDKYMLIIMEYISGGNLQAFVKKRRKLIEKTAKILFKQIMEGIAYIHSQNVVHRDIKLENILIDLNNNIKICDFGVGKIIKSHTILTDQCGTPVYMAPEIIVNNGYSGRPVDIWSSGVALYIMLSGNCPFNRTENNDLEHSIINSTSEAIPGITPEAEDLLKKLLSKDPLNRPTAEEVLNHPWLSKEEFNMNDRLNVNKYHLFTAAEMILLSKTHIDYRKGNAEELLENFTFKNLISIDDGTNKNADTKSFILAPYNSYNSIEAEDYDGYPGYIEEELLLENNIIKFCNKAKEFNLNYELNNNEEIDNGMLINSKYDLENNDSLSLVLNAGDEIQAQEQEKEKIKGQGKGQENNKDNANDNKERRHNSLSQSHKLFKVNNNDNRLQINQEILMMVSELGYKKEYVIKCLNNNELCQATTIYYLLLNYDNMR